MGLTIYRCRSSDRGTPGQENGNNMFGMHQANDIFYGFSDIEKSDYSIAGDKFELVVRGKIIAPVSYGPKIGENFLYGYLHDARNSSAYHRGHVKFGECGLIDTGEFSMTFEISFSIMRDDLVVEKNPKRHSLKEEDRLLNSLCFSILFPLVCQDCFDYCPLAVLGGGLGWRLKSARQPISGTAIYDDLASAKENGPK